MNQVPTPGDWDVSAPDEIGSASTRLDRIGTVLAGEVTSGRVPGAVIGILRYGKLAYLRTVGWRDPVARIPMTPDALFWIASMTKPVTAVAALTLVEQGQLLLGDPVSASLPEFTGMRVAVRGAQGRPRLVPARHEPAVHDLMTHTAGIIEAAIGGAWRLFGFAGAGGLGGFEDAVLKPRNAGV